MTQPAPVAGRFVLYTSSAHQLWLTGLNARTCATVWWRPAFPSAIAGGEAPSLAVFGHVVVYLQRRGGSGADVVAADAATGRVIWHSPAGWFTSWPDVCPDAPAEVCLTAYLGTSFQGMLLRFNARTGAALRPVTLSWFSPAGELAPGLFFSLATPQQIARVSGSSVSWTHTLSSAFPRAGASLSAGWDFDRVSRTGLFVGSVGWLPVSRTATSSTTDLSHAMTAGIRIANGSVAWRDNGTTYDCGFLPCPGSSQEGYSSATAAAGPAIGLRLRSTGTETLTVSRSAPTTLRKMTLSPGEHTVIEGFAPATGATLWTFNAGQDPGLLTGGTPPAQVSAHTLLLAGAGKRLMLLNLITGAARPARPGITAWCRSPVFYWLAAGGRVRAMPFPGQLSLFPCSTHWREVPVPARAPAFVAGIGASAGGLVAWSEPSAVVAAPPA